MSESADVDEARSPEHDHHALEVLVTIAARFGIVAECHQVARENRISDTLVSTRDMIRCARSIGLEAEALRLDWADLGQLGKGLPAIIALRNGSYMIIERAYGQATDRRVELRDPSISTNETLLIDELRFDQISAGEIILVRRTYCLTDTEQPFGFGLVASFILREGRVVSDVALSAAALSLLALAPILFWRLMTDRVLQFHAMATFWVLCVSLVILIGFEVSFFALRRYLLIGLTTRVDIRLATYMFHKVIGLPIQFFEVTPAGYTMHQMAQLGRIRTFMLGQLFGTVLDAGVLIVFVPVMALFSPVLTAFVLALCMLIMVVIVSALPALRRRGGRVEEAEADRGAMLAQTIQGIKTVKSLALDARQKHQWDVLTARVARARVSEGHFSNIIQSIVLPLERMVVSGSLAVGVFMAVSDNSSLDVGTLFAFLMLSQKIASPLIQISQLIQQFDEARSAVGVVAALVNQPPEEGRGGQGVRKPILGHVEFQNVLFSYKGAIRPALKNLPFEVPRGTSLGVMGRSGSGKTTITRLVQRLHSVYSGLIKIDGVDVRQYDVDFLRASLGVVLQENFLFSGTIRENITIAKPDAGYDEMVMAARLAGAEEFIEKLPGGYETYIYEGSPNLSGGQRQRLAIARALITDPRILILDEATSALDAESEAIVNANIERIAQGRTVITISHRLAALVTCDAIMVLDGGAIDDIGRHEELLERNDIYSHLWYTQNRHAGGPPPAGAGEGRRPQPKLAYRGPR